MKGPHGKRFNYILGNNLEWIQLAGCCTNIEDCVWNVMAHGDARAEKWRGNKGMEWVTSKRHMTAEYRLARAVQTLQADVYSSPASSRLNWPSSLPPGRFKWTRPFRRKAKSGFCACAITFQTQSTKQASSITMRSTLKCWASVFPERCIIAVNP